ncbi:EAP30/Vps36 family-domain-containing protein [Gorgonomyces haynaldii]|nr:EAP30/Vps36 family-domain-containing protein [Gorgonomyces haynaldii]
MRKVGIAGIQQKSIQNQIFQQKQQELQQKQLGLMKEQLEIFRANLQEFATKYSHRIKKDPVFRQRFNQLCANIGVDPLASQKGFWSVLMGDFYHELGVLVVQVCIDTRTENGGLIDLDELVRLVGQKKKVDKEDVIQSIKRLGPLGSGFQVLKVGNKQMVQSVPKELNQDALQVLELAQVTGFVTLPLIQNKYQWDTERIQQVLDHLIQDQICWIDTHPIDSEYWVAGFFQAT